MNTFWNNSPPSFGGIWILLKLLLLGVLVSTRLSSIRWQVQKQPQVTAKLRLRSRTIQHLPRAALSLLVFQRMADSWCSMLCALAFVLWSVTQLLHGFSTFSFISLNCDLCSWFYLWFPSRVFFFFLSFPLFCSWLIADMCFMVCPLSLAMSLTNWKLLIKGWWLSPWACWLLRPWHNNDLICAVTIVWFLFSELWLHMCPVLFPCYLLYSTFSGEQGLYSAKN